MCTFFCHGERVVLVSGAWSEVYELMNRTSCEMRGKSPLCNRCICIVRKAHHSSVSEGVFPLCHHP